MNTFRQNRWLKGASVFLLLAIMTIGIAKPVQAAIFDDDGIVKAEEVIDDDVFLSGANVQMDGTINGSLIATGQKVTITGTVNGDAILTGSEIFVTKTAKIQGNLFAGASAVVIEGQVDGSVASGSTFIQFLQGAAVGRNVYYGGFSLETQPETNIERSLYGGVYQAKINGQVMQDVQLEAGAVEIGGIINQNAKINLGDTDISGTEFSFSPFMFMPNMSVPMPATLNPGLRISPDAQIKGQLTYTSNVNQTNAFQSQPAGGIVFQTPVPKTDGTTEETKPLSGVKTFVNSPIVKWVLNFIRNLVTLMILGALALWLVRPWLNRATEMVSKKAAPSAGYGFLVILVTYAGAFFVAIAVLMLTILFTVITLGGLGRTIAGVGFSSLALFMAIFGLLVTYISKLVMASFIGEWIMGKLSPKATGRAFWALGIGIVIYVFLRSIPFIGWIFGLLATLFGIGAMWLVYQQWRGNRAPIISQDLPGETTLA